MHHQSHASKSLIFAANWDYRTGSRWQSDPSNFSLNCTLVFILHIFQIGFDWYFRSAWSARPKRLSGQQASLESQAPQSGDKTCLRICKSGWNMSCDNVNSSCCRAVTTSFLALPFLCRLLTEEHVNTVLTLRSSLLVWLLPVSLPRTT